MANVCFIGKHKHNSKILEEQQDSQVWLSLAEYFDNFCVIGESENLKFGFDKFRNIKLYTLPSFSWPIFNYPFFIIQAIVLGLVLNFEQKIDFFDASEVLGGGISCLVLKFLTGKPFIQEIQGEIFNLPNFEPFLKRKILKIFGRLAAKKAYKVRANSHAVASQIASQGINPGKIFVVPLRVRMNIFNPENFNTSELKSKAGFDDRLTIGFLGRLAPEKGLFDLLSAFKEINEKVPNSLLLLFGSGPEEHHLRLKTDELGLGGKVKFMGRVEYEKVPKALSMIDIFAHPSLHEGFGRSILEALAMEKAVVATKVGGIPDLINDGHNGFLVEPRNSQTLASKILELAQSPELRIKFGKAGREWVKENFEWNSGIKKFANLFQ